MTDPKILKAVLMLRRLGNKHQSKEEQIEEQEKWLAEIVGYRDEFDGWIGWMREELAKSPEQREAETEKAFEEFLEREAEYDMQESRMYRHERDEWDDLWDDRARSCGAIW